MRTLLLVAEVLSPSSLKGDRFLKRLRYREAGVPLYWVVDGDEAPGRGLGPGRRFSCRRARAADLAAIGSG